MISFYFNFFSIWKGKSWLQVRERRKSLKVKIICYVLQTHCCASSGFTSEESSVHYFSNINYLDAKKFYQSSTDISPFWIFLVYFINIFKKNKMLVTYLIKVGTSWKGFQ